MAKVRHVSGLSSFIAVIVITLTLILDPSSAGASKRGVKTQSGHWYYPLHPELFDDRTGPREEWFDASFLAAIAGGDADLRRVITREHPEAHVYSFPFLQPHFATMLLEEAQYYNASGLPNKKPNGMNNYGILWNAIGMHNMFEKIQQRYIAPVARLIFPHVGGGTLDHQHTYLVQYSTDMDPHGLDVHHDACDITFNAALDNSSQYEGSGLSFCGLYTTDEYRKYLFTYRHVLGRAILYDGRQRHGADPILAGERTNLVMWSHSEKFRSSKAYEKHQIGRHRVDGGADPRCVSYHHDEDYCRYQLPDYETRCTQNGKNRFKPAWRKALGKQDYWQVGVVLDGAGTSSTASGAQSKAGLHQKQTSAEL